MYGTIARLQAKPGMKNDLLENFREQERRNMAGFVGSYVYQMDKNSDEYYLAVMFEDKKTYLANAEDPQQDVLYRKLMKCLAAEPEWHDGEIVAVFDVR
jgi:hypothetical protein